VSRFNRAAISSVASDGWRVSALISAARPCDGADVGGLRRPFMVIVSVQNLRPVVGVDVPNENPASRHDKGFRHSHCSGTLALMFDVLLSGKILLASREDISDRVVGEGLVGPQNQDVTNLRRNACPHIGWAILQAEGGGNRCCTRCLVRIVQPRCDTDVTRADCGVRIRNATRQSRVWRLRPFSSPP
jgi:hypothetical protein